MDNNNISDINYMDNNNILSETEEMYLVTIRKICEHCTDTPIPIPDIALGLGVQPVTVNQMINKLADIGLVKYYPYKGVELTSEGHDISTRILRNRRLWEVFLVKFLEMEVDEADQIACQFEHYTTPDVASRLSNFLGNPTVCFHGDIIPPDTLDNDILFEGTPLSDLQIGYCSPVIRIESDPAITKFLSDEGVRLGVEVCPISIGQRGDILLKTPSGNIHISSELSSRIIVSNSTRVIEIKNLREQKMLVPLSNIKVGEKGIIQKINFKGAIRQRLMAMGLVIGETIFVKRVAPLGDPIDFIIKGYELSLRKEEANKILVTPI